MESVVMSTNIVNLDQAKRLKALGMPQGASHQYWWWCIGGLLRCKGELGCGERKEGVRVDCADAPDLITALGWFRAHGLYWNQHTWRTPEGEDQEHWWMSKEVRSDTVPHAITVAEADSLSDLLDAVLTRLSDALAQEVIEKATELAFALNREALEELGT